MLLVLLEGCDVHLIPLALASLKASAFGPIKWSSICTRVGIAHADVSGEVLLCSHADIYPLASNRSKDITFDTHSNFLLCINSQSLLYSILHWACKRSLHCQLGSSTIVVDYMEVICKVTSRDQVLAQHFVYVLTSSKVKLFVKVQDRSVANKTVVLTRRWRKYHNLFYSESQRLICSELEEYIILFQHIKEYTTKLVFLLCASSDDPIFLYHCTSRTVKTHIKRHIGWSCALVGDNKLELFVASLYLAKIQHEPFLASFH